MKKLLAVTLFILISPITQASDGETIYKNVCSQCHSMQKGWEIKDKTTLKAPPFPGVTNAVRKAYNNEAQFIEFVSSYIKNPTKIRARTKDMAIQRFGLMPKSIAEKMSKEERESIAKWMFNNVGLD